MPTSLAALLALFADNTSGDISAADGRAAIQALYDWIPDTQKYLRGRLAGETAHAADDFFTTYTGYTEVDVTGTVDWAATRGGLTATYSGQSTGDFSCSLKAIPVAGVPITIETKAVNVLAQADSPLWGILFTDGTAATSNIAGFGKVAAATGTTAWYQMTGTITSATTTVVGGGFDQLYPEIGTSFIRLIWASANTFAWSLSPDSENWTDFGQADFTPTITPTHMGFFVSSWGTNGTQVVTFHYLRVYEADLSL